MELIAKLLTQQRALSEFGRFAFRSLDLDATLSKAAEACAKGMDAPLCKVCRYRPEQNDLLVQAGYGWQPDVIGFAVSQADSTTPGGAAFVGREPVICEDLTEADFVLPPFYAQHGIISTVNVIIPGSNGDRPYGILEIDVPNSRAFDEQDITFLTGFANVLAEAVATNRRMEQLHAALSEKEVLSRELQHRVRNNLHLIYNMLAMEAGHYETDDIRGSFQEIANRVRALATVYDHLLGTGMARSLAFNEYLTKLCDTLREFQPGTVSLVQRASATVTVDLDTATAVGMAITEIISNAYKHAFPNGEGQIEVAVELRQVPVIRIHDNGVGIEHSQQSKRRGLGLVQRLVEQVNGSFNLNSGANGTQCEIVLPRVNA